MQQKVNQHNILHSYNLLCINNWLQKKTDYGQILDRLRVGAIVSILFTELGELQMVVDGVNFGTFVKINPKFRELYPIIDVYGKCEQVNVFLFVWQLAILCLRKNIL